MVIPADVGENLLPRRYQEEIFARAQEGNIIAALDTGSGKTFISLLLMKWVVAHGGGGTDKKVVVFLVPKVALVEQQADFISRHTPLRVKRFHGAMQIEMADRGSWKQEFESTDIVVLTAQIFLNIITHSHWSMEKILLIVFDECHHCRKNHAYNGIMREYFSAQPGHRPKVFGMTASPIWNPKDAVESLATLEKNMNCKVMAVREHAEELMEHLPKPKEVTVGYGPPPSTYPTYPSIPLRERIRPHEYPPEWDIPWDKIESRYEVTKQAIGPYGAEYYLYTELRYRIIQLFTNADDAAKANMDVMLAAYSSLDMDAMQEPEFIPPSPKVLELDTLLAKYSPLFADAQDAPTTTLDVSLEWCTPQVRTLAEILLEHYTPSFQGIVFVEQRHVAFALARLLPRLTTLKGKIKSAELVGHGASAAAKAKVRGMALQNQQDVVKQFRNGELNLLIATSVAEEGLDFPACDVVIRFDPIQHMVGYVQSRGRARHKTSTFVVMVQEGHGESLTRYKALAELEPELKKIYLDNAKKAPVVDAELEEGEIDETDHPTDVAERERFMVPSTGAILTYNSAIGLLNHLCSLIPRDRFTPPQVPQFTGDYECTLQLPSSLPLPPKYLQFHGPFRHSKREAKRAVSFIAVKTLYKLGVFDEYLLPIKSSSSADSEDAEGIPVGKLNTPSDIMSVYVRDPWTMDHKIWLHIVYINEKPTAGIVTGTALSDIGLTWESSTIRIGSTARAVLEASRRQRELMHDYMRIGVWWSITGRGTKLPMACYLVPIVPATLEPDYEAMADTGRFPWGSHDWSNIGEKDYHRLLCMNYKEHGNTLLLRRIRHDLTPMSRPPPGSRESNYQTYRDWYIHLYTRKGIPPEIPMDGPLIELHRVPRQMSSAYYLHAEDDIKEQASSSASNAILLPQALVRWVGISIEVFETFHLLPRLLHRITDVYRAERAKIELGLPAPISTDLLVEALTLPSTNSSWSNQRLETLGDAVLKLGIVVHLFNRFPHRHEGQLDILRRTSVANKTLLTRAIQIDLMRFVSGEPLSLRNWRYSMPDFVDWRDDPRAIRYAAREIARNSMQDCMEALLGASFLAGGINIALHTATSLGIALGGPVPWSVRYSRPALLSRPSPLFEALQEDMGHCFHRNELLLEAMTHPSFKNNVGSSYQRLEFMGDALIDLVVTHYLFRKFPKATPGQLSWARSRAVCAPALAYVAVNRLRLHNLLLVNNVELSIAIARYVPILQDLSITEILHKGWKHDPPKALSDVMESVMGAVLVDSAYNLDITTAVVEYVFADILEVLSPDLPKDPMSELMTWVAKAGCQQVRFKKFNSQNQSDMKKGDGMAVIAHDRIVAGPIGGSNLSLAKGLVSERARVVLGSVDHPHSLAQICDCHRLMDVDKPKIEDDDGATPSDADPDDETVEGFAVLARDQLEIMDGKTPVPEQKNGDDGMEDDEMAVDLKLE